MRYRVFGLLFLSYPLSLDVREMAHRQQGRGFRITKDHGSRYQDEVRLFVIIKDQV